jgi:EAL domain-containing protein (putative c-di-GMP-specific phosphodiesterase class I)/GGDEF domain-containing protein
VPTGDRPVHSETVTRVSGDDADDAGVLDSDAVPPDDVMLTIARSMGMALSHGLVITSPVYDDGQPVDFVIDWVSPSIRTEAPWVESGLSYPTALGFAEDEKELLVRAFLAGPVLSQIRQLGFGNAARTYRWSGFPIDGRLVLDHVNDVVGFEERRNARQTEFTLAAMLDALDAAIVMLEPDPSGGLRVSYQNAAAKSLHSEPDADPWPPESAKPLEEAARAALGSGAHVQLPYPTTPGCKFRQALVTCVPTDGRVVVKVSDRTPEYHATVALERTRAEQTALAETDYRTQRPNRRALIRELATNGAPSVVVTVYDVSELSALTSSVGYAHVDQLLQLAAERIDTATGTPAYHMGAGVFATVDAETPSLVRGAATARAAVSALTAPYRAESVNLRVSASAGIVGMPLHGDDPEIAVQRAEVAASAAGRTPDRALLWDASMSREQDEHLKLLGEFDTALHAGGLNVDFMTRWDLMSDTLAGVTANVRWRHPELGPIPAAQLHTLAEHPALAREYAHAVIVDALNDWCTHSSRWPGVRVFVQVPAWLHTVADLDVLVGDALVESGCSGDILSLGISDPAEPGSIDTLIRVAELGVSLHLLHLGATYIPATLLRKLPLSGVKLHRSLVRDVDRDEKQKALVKAALQVADAFGMEVTATGVERSEEKEELVLLGCRFAEGHLFTKPGPIGKILPSQKGRTAR